MRLGRQAVAAHEAPSKCICWLATVVQCLHAWRRTCYAAVLHVLPAHMQMPVLTWHALQGAACVAAGGADAQPGRIGLCPTLRHERTHVSWPRALLMPCACARLGAGLRACLVTQCYEGAAPAERQAWLWERLGASGRSKLAYQAFLGRAPMPV
jgi:hypothetical protein